MAVTEIVRMYPKAGAAGDLQNTLAKAVDLLTAHPDCLGVKVFRGIEDPNSILLHVKWTSVEAHETWRASDARGKWRTKLGDFLEKPNDVGHYRTVLARV